MAEPAKHLLIFAFLGAHFAKRLPELGGYPGLVRDTGVSKQNLMKLVRGDTVGTDILFRIAESVGGGSVDALHLMARNWWATLGAEEKSAVTKRTDLQLHRRTSSKRGASTHEAEEVKRLVGVAPRVTAPSATTKAVAKRLAPARKG